VRLWLRLVPWIEEGLVTFVRSPGDFDWSLRNSCLEVTQRRYQNSPELRTLLDKELEVHRSTTSQREFTEYLFLAAPDHVIAKVFFKAFPGASERELELYMKVVQKCRDAHPYFIAQLDAGGQAHGEFFTVSSGTNYEIAKSISAISGSHLITDLLPRWKEMEFDRDQLGVQLGPWTPFAKAFQGLTFKFLNNVSLRAALTLRREGRLEGMRAFFRRIWRAAAADNPLDDANTKLLADELTQEINEAEEEWRKIDLELLKWFASESVVGMAAQAIAPGTASWLPGAAVVLAGVANLGISRHRRHQFPKRHPAGFFLDLKKTTSGS
jgi:hypothetical protein